jgi:predicted RNA binding protein YcfA (HicA-like mRNA interferase family)
LIRHLTDAGCVKLREGGKHEIWRNPETKGTAPIPRHAEINQFTAKQICKALDVSLPGCLS